MAKYPMLWKLLDCLPYKLHYLLLWVKEKKTLPNLVSPRSYSEFVFRDCFFKRHDKRAYLADKYAVREYVKQKGLESSLTKIYGVWDDATKIDFAELPDKFALKCNHSCATNIVFDDKSQLNQSEAVEKLNNWLQMKHPRFFEHHYQKIKPLIICEEYLSDAEGNFPTDYKIHCANGKPVFIQVCFERTRTDAGRRSIYDTSWKNLHFVKEDSHYSDLDVEKPDNLDEMLRQASILSDGLDYARVDFYNINGKVVFGEITLTPMGGWLSYFTDDAQKMMGDAIRQGIKERKKSKV